MNADVYSRSVLALIFFFYFARNVTIRFLKVTQAKNSGIQSGVSGTKVIILIPSVTEEE